jgi:hypothetical protein
MLLCKYCNKECKNDNSLRNHERLCSKNPNKQIAKIENLNNYLAKKMCKFCLNDYSLGNLTKHEKSCKQNPLNFKECPVCKKNHTKKSVTCSYSCSNTFFRSGKNNPNWKEHSYRTTCFEFHKKQCIVCGEEKIVTVHHLNEDHSDNRPENLIPLCPTHHQYVHSRYKEEVQSYIDDYIKTFISVRGSLVDH